MSNVITADQFSNIYALYVHGRTPLSVEYEEESDDTESVYHDPFCDIFWDELIAGFMEVFEKALNPLERDIVIRRVVYEHTLIAIGKVHGVSDEAIRSRCIKALRKIRCYLARHDDNRFVNTIRESLDDDGPIYAGTDLCRILSASKDSCWYKQYILSDEMIKLLRQKPVKQKPKAKKRKKPVVVSEPPVVVDDKVDQEEQEPIEEQELIDDNDYLNAYVADNSYGVAIPVRVRFERVNGSVAYMVFKEIHCNEYRMVIDSVNVQLESCTVRIAGHLLYMFTQREVDINLCDFLNNLGMDYDIREKSKSEIATAVLQWLSSE